MGDENKIKDQIFNLVAKLYRERGINKKESGKDYLNYAGSIFDHREVNEIINSLLEGWLGLGEKADEFQKRIAQYCDTKYSIVTNSGSSANLLTIATLCSKQMDNPLKFGDEIITPAATFPTTLNPIIQYNLVPIFVDIQLGSYTINPDALAHVITDKTKGIMIPHVLGNPNEMDTIMNLAKEKNLYVIEDCCDALGSTYRGKKVGSWGNFGTLSFYPAHHITMGEGGALLSNDKKLIRIAKSIRDWGRACYCFYNEKSLNGACNKRFNYEIDGVKIDHRYVYSNIGYNLKPLELQCAMGIEQLNKLPEFINSRKRNFDILMEALRPFETKIILPKATENSDVNWFAFPITIKENTKINREEFQKYLERSKIQTRVLFAGNILKHTPYNNIKYKQYGKLENTNIIFRNTFFVGIYPGLSEENMLYIADKIKYFINNQ